MYALLVYLVTVPLLVFCTIVYDEHKHEISNNTANGGTYESIIHLKNDKNFWFAKVRYESSFTSKGWDFLHIETNPLIPDIEQAYFAGFLEGHASHTAIYNHWYNTVRPYCNKQVEFCRQVNTYLDRNLAWMRKTVNPHQMSNDPFWHQVDLFDRQVLGLYEGYNRCFQPRREVLTLRDFIWLNFMAEIETLKSTFNATLFPETLNGLDHCSALIKLLPGYKDLLVSHVTWTGYHYMLRVIKRYDLHYHTAFNNKTKIPGKSMTFSGYPGVVTSVDDYYIIKSGLVVLETTIGNNNNSLWQLVHPTGQVSAAIRSMVANRLARNGREWSKIFSQYNNGLYNNQWMIVDMNKFVHGWGLVSTMMACYRQPPQRDTLWIVEQTPGFIMAADRTETLIQQLYWPSYNIPSFPEVYKRMGNDKFVKQYGDWFSYENAPRAKIFKRDQMKVTDADSMIRLMRSNNYKNDPYSACNCTPPYSAANAISCRDDLNPKYGKYPFPALGHRNHGAIDAKVTNYYLSMRLQFHAVSGPTRGNNLPPFQWSKSDFKNLSHLGQPDEFNFPTVLHTWN